MFNHFMRKKLKTKATQEKRMSFKSSDSAVVLIWACVPMPQGEPQNYSLLFLCSTDTILRISPQHIYYMLAFFMNIVPKKKICKTAWKA